MGSTQSQSRTPRPVSETQMKDVEVLKGLLGLRALSDSTRVQMIQILMREPATGSMLARSLGIPANRAHYHLKRLLDVGLISALDTAPKARTEERFYRAAARHILVDPGLVSAEEQATFALRQSIDTTFLDWRRSQVLDIDWGLLAGIVAQKALRVRQGDQVLILFAPIALEAAEAILVEVEACGGTAHPRPWSRNTMLRTLDRYSPDQLSELPLVPPAIDERLTAAVLLTSSLVQGAPPNPAQRELLPRLLQSVSAWKRSVAARGLRYVYVGLPHRAEFEQGFVSPEAGIDAFWRCVTADLTSIHDRGDDLRRLVRLEPELLITGADGTALRVTVDPSSASTSDGIISDEDLRCGRSTESVPAGAFGVLPVTGTGEGAFIADYTFAAGRHLRNVRVVLRQGRIAELTADGDIQSLRDRLASESGEPGTLSGITLGLNPGAQGPTGRPELDSLLAGVVTLHFGNNELWGGSVKSTFNLSLPAHGVTVRTRTRTLVTAGRFGKPQTTTRWQEK